VSGTLGVTLANAVYDAETGDEGTPDPIVVVGPGEDNN
jgi:hypothetical protein